MNFACFGDSITSDQVTGIGTRVCEILSMSSVGNYACGYATCSDWHKTNSNGESVHLTPFLLNTPPNTNTANNVISNQIRRILQATTPQGETISWTHPAEGIFYLDPSIGRGTGSAEYPDIIYIAISTNDGNHIANTVSDDRKTVFQQKYSELTCESIASAMRWCIETLQCAYPKTEIFVASPLMTCCPLSWMSFESNRLKRDIIKDAAEFTGVHFIDSFYESGFDTETARDHGEVHPDEEWKEKIAAFVAGKIRDTLKI